MDSKHRVKRSIILISNDSKQMGTHKKGEFEFLERDENVH